MTLFVAPIIEGKTEVQCIQIILKRVWKEILGDPELCPIEVLQPIRGHRSSLILHNHPELTRKIEQASRVMLPRMQSLNGSRGLILILIDTEEDCPASLGPQLHSRAKSTRTDLDIACVLAKRELENWFKAAAASLAGKCGLPANLVVPGVPENGSGGRWLSKQIQTVDPKRKYTKPGDAVELAQQMDLHQCRTNSPSFNKLCRDLAARLPPSPPPQLDANLDSEIPG